jgi:hypothetical protein
VGIGGGEGKIFSVLLEIKPSTAFPARREVKLVSAFLLKCYDKEGAFLMCLYASIAPDNKKLVRFKKIDLQPGETKTVTFRISARDLAFYNKTNQLVAEKGDFILQINNFEQRIILSENITFGVPSSIRM